MVELRIKPEVLYFENFPEFADQALIGEDDLIITNRYIYDADMEQVPLSCHIMFQEDYGYGPLSDVMLESICQAVPAGIRRVIGVGGGTVLDISKLVSLKQCTPARDLYDGRIKVVRDKALVLIPTTCGTGSEVTDVAVMSFAGQNNKLGLVADGLYADQAVLIPHLLATLPFNVFATTSLDALIHAVEAALSPDADCTIKMFAYKAIEMILSGYLVLKEEGAEKRHDLSASFLRASMYAGVASTNAGCGPIHALSYPLGAKYHVPHGEANYVLFMAVMRLYAGKKNEGALVELNQFLAKVLHCTEADVYAVLEELLGLVMEKKSLDRYGVRESDLQNFTDTVMTSQARLMSNAFVLLDRDDVYGLYNELYV
jgi:4-hydroxybutyrate dehydrogenase